MPIRKLEDRIVETITRIDSRPFPYGEEPSLVTNKVAISYRFTGGELEVSLDAEPLLDSLTWDIDVFSTVRSSLFERVEKLSWGLVAEGFNVSVGGEFQTEDLLVYGLTLTVSNNGG